MYFNIGSALTVTLALCSGVVSALTADQQAALDLHNKGRNDLNYPTLSWDSGLQSKAQAWANTLAQRGKLEHAGVGGENLYWISAGGSLKGATQSWMNEKSKYKGEKIPEGNFAGYGHYTQCMWKTTKKVGMASARDSKGGLYVVARYDPAGNIRGQKL
ncbi:hypothetical protein GGTG_07441 [Gaeumannomyces tritici R3-111a-1]|uniref:SCP domain-containing protein n=1 Tax=Gaeumannomyces tritici (strain R3-111a-1) TaxID=644352 RepID=J3P1P3_GAET3|nr:hypothetical protein GGTG_07441 [Gaeumannomyces tritici R3-111a-1]EJT73585.1 hypothetical protein GGTG_07441 [Gaeumannomyces tritici R3-111a-1]